MTETATTDPLVAAYHAIFDVKDATDPDRALYFECYTALNALAAVMASTGVTVPRRFDAPVVKETS